jgi:hypothetical protein
MSLTTPDHKVAEDAQGGFVNLRVQMAGANYPKHALTYLSADYKVTDITAADKVSCGEVFVPATEVDGYGTICTRFRRVLKDANAAGAIAVGEYVKSAADIGGVQSFQKWDPASDTADTIEGQALQAASVAGDDIDIGLF